MTTAKLTPAQQRIVDLLKWKFVIAHRYELADALPAQIRGPYAAESHPFPTRTVNALERLGVIKVKRTDGWVRWVELAEAWR
jgi:hypothetical protein